MAFLPYKFDGSVRPQSIEYMPCSAITPKVGMTLKWSSGNLAIAATNDKPEYSSLVEKTAACTAGDIIPVLRVLPDMVFAVPSQGDNHATVNGDKVQIYTGGLLAGAKNSSGSLELVGKEGDGYAGDILYVRIP